MRVYIADLGAYNAGTLRGQWFDPTEYADGTDFLAAVEEFIAKRPGAEEWAIHDTEDTCGIDIGEHESLDDVWETARLLEVHGQAWADYAGNVGSKYATEDGFADAYCGQYDSGADYAEATWRETSEYETRRLANDWPFSCIDWERAWRELSYDGYWISDSGNVFRSV